MNLPEILLTILIISLFCCGLSVVSGEGMVGYFLRKPFDKLRDFRDKKITFLKLDFHHNDDREYFKEQIKASNIILYISKPIILCCTCMASFWGIVIFAALHGFHVHLIKYMVICCICSCFINAFFMSKYNAG